MVLEVPGNGLGAGVQARVGQLLAQPHDPVNQLGGQGGRGALGPSGAWLQGSLTLGPS